MRSKRLILIVLTCIVALVSITGCSSSFDDTQYAVISENNLSPDGFVYSVYENNTAVITGINTSDAELTIPDTIGSYKVVEIGADAFSGDEVIKLVTIGANVEKTGDNAFADCLSLIRVDMTENVKKIGSGAFYNCENLCEVKGATGVIVIDEVAFYCCSALARFDLPETLRTIGNEAFGACESLVEVKLPEKIESIGIGAFSYCSSLSRLDLGGLTNIPEKAFLRCTSLGSVVIGKKVTDIGVQAFRGCDVLKYVHIEKGVKYIGGAAFSTCPLIEINYSGSESNWKKIKMPAGAEEFANINVSYKQKLDKAN